MPSVDQGIRSVCRLKGHESAVLCCSIVDENTLASGTEVSRRHLMHLLTQASIFEAMHAASVRTASWGCTT